MELELAIMKKRRELSQRTKALPLTPLLEERDAASWTTVQHGTLEHLSKGKNQREDDTVSDASTDINSLASDLESLAHLSENS